MDNRVVPLPRPEFAIDLDEDDKSEILNSTNLLPGRWRAKFFKGENGRSCAYIFHTGQTADVCPVFTITRTSKGYTVVCWDLLVFFWEGQFEASVVAQTIDG